MFRRGVALAAVTGGLASPAAAQSPPEPSIKLGTTIFVDYAIQQAPKVPDADGHRVTLSSFDITRAYLNISGRISPALTFRVTPDITRETGPGSSLNGSYTFRLKLAYAQLALDRWMPSGSWTRFGQQGTPWVDFIQDVYHYRFQGPIFAEREGYLSSADAGATVRVPLPHDYGDVHGGFYNGEGSYHPELNDRKAYVLRTTIRPLPREARLHGLRVTAFVDRDAYSRQRDRNRAIASATYEHRRFNAGVDYLAASDRPPGQALDTRAHGWSAFVTPRLGYGWEGLFRYDHLQPDLDRPAELRRRAIGGVAYWLAPQNGVTSAILFDVEQTTFTAFLPEQPTQRRFAVHVLVNY